MSTIYRGPSKGASYYILFDREKRFQRKRLFRNRPIRNKNCLLLPCVSSDRIKNSNHYRAPSIDASYQGSVYLAKRFQRRRFLEIDQSETRIACGGHICKRIRTISNIYRGYSKKASCQILVHFGKRFQRRKLPRNRPTRNKNCL